MVKAYIMQAADALSLETRIKSGITQELVIGPLLFFLFVVDLSRVIKAIAALTKRYFAELPLQ